MSCGMVCVGMVAEVLTILIRAALWRFSPALSALRWIILIPPVLEMKRHIECYDPPPTTVLGVPRDSPPGWRRVPGAACACSSQGCTGGNYSDAECWVDSHCSSDSKPYCRQPSLYSVHLANTCVQCTADSHCSGSTPKCNTSRFTCQECDTDNGGCSGSTPYCAKLSGTLWKCGECSDHDHCSAPTPYCRSVNEEPRCSAT